MYVSPPVNFTLESNFVAQNLAEIATMKIQDEFADTASDTSSGQDSGSVSTPDIGEHVTEQEIVIKPEPDSEASSDLEFEVDSDSEGDQKVTVFKTTDSKKKDSTDHPEMYEIFITAVVQNEDILKARAILAGVTKSQEYHHFMRIQHFEPQDLSTRGLPTIKEIQKERNTNPHVPAWVELNTILLKQQYTVRIHTKINKDEVESAKNDSGNRPVIPPNRVRVLKWCEMPDPPSQHLAPWISQRRALDILDPRAENILLANRFQYVPLPP